MSYFKLIKQHYEGYLNPSKFSKQIEVDGYYLSEKNIQPSLIGLVVDYYTRFLDGTELILAFKVPLEGAIRIGKRKEANILLSKITNEMTDETILITLRTINMFSFEF